MASCLCEPHHQHKPHTHSPVPPTPLSFAPSPSRLDASACACSPAALSVRQAKTCVLLCTDVAARGLDFPAVSTIIQYDPAGDPAEYVHRVGRTARMGQQGEALLFLLHSEMPYIDLLQQRGMQLQPERAEAVLRCLPALLVGSDPGAAGSIHRLAKKLRQEASTAAGQPGGAGAGAKGSGKGQHSKPGAGTGDGGLSGAQAEGQAAALMLQRQLLQVISGDEELQQLALNAFRWVALCGWMAVLISRYWQVAGHCCCSDTTWLSAEAAYQALQSCSPLRLQGGTPSCAAVAAQVVHPCLRHPPLLPEARVPHQEPAPGPPGRQLWPARGAHAHRGQRGHGGAQEAQGARAQGGTEAPEGGLAQGSKGGRG